MKKDYYAISYVYSQCDYRLYTQNLAYLVIIYVRYLFYILYIPYLIIYFYLTTVSAYHIM